MIRSLKRINIVKKSLLFIFINRLIRNGKKSILYKTFLTVLIRLKFKLKKSFNNILEKIITAISPSIQLRPKFASGVIYLIPDFPKYKKSVVLGLSLFVRAVKQRREVLLKYRILYEFRDILRNRGLTLKFKKDFYKLGLNNRHLLFKFNKK